MKRAKKKGFKFSSRERKEGKTTTTATSRPYIYIHWPLKSTWPKRKERKLQLKCTLKKRQNGLAALRKARLVCQLEIELIGVSFFSLFDQSYSLLWAEQFRIAFLLGFCFRYRCTKKSGQPIQQIYI